MGTHTTDHPVIAELRAEFSLTDSEVLLLRFLWYRSGLTPGRFKSRVAERLTRVIARSQSNA